MKFCPYCGKNVSQEQDICLNCGKVLKTNINVQNSNNETSTGTKIICALVGLIFPIIGAILYYVFKKSNPDLSKICNICSWIGFILMLFNLFWWMPYLLV